MKKIYVIMALTSALSCMTACEKKMDETASQTVYTAAVDSYFTEAEENNGQTETSTTVVSESEVPENTLENSVTDTEKAIESVQTESDNPGELPVIFFEEPAVTTVVTVSADDTEENASSKAQEEKPETISTKLPADDTDLPEIMVEEPVVIVTTVPSPSDDTEKTEKPVSVQTTTTGKNGETPFIPAVTTPTAVATVTSVTETVTTKVTTTVTNPEEENIELPFVPAL